MKPLVSHVPFTTLLACTLALASCSSEGASPGPNGAASPADGGAIDDGAASPALPPPCPDGSRAEGGTCVTTLSLAVSPTAIAPARDHHTTHVFETKAGAYLYVFGGTPSWASVYNDIQRAKIGADGSLAEFEPAGTMREKRAGHSTVRVKDSIIVIAGTVQRGASMNFEGSTDVGKIGDDGKIDGFVAGPVLPVGVMHHSVEVKGDYLFVFGGRGTGKGVSVDQVVRSKLGPDGTPGPFEKLAPLPEARSHMMSFQYGDYVYLAGGLTGDPMDNPPSRKDIVRAKLGDDGSLGEWEPAGKIPKGLSVSAAQVFARHVFFVGGLPSGSAYTNVVQSAAFDENGLLGETKALSAKLSSARAHVHQTPMFGRFMYAVGGHLDTEESIGVVEVGTFNAP